MGDRTKPPFRADHVGSLLRPKSITNGFKKLRSMINKFTNKSSQQKETKEDKEDKKDK